MQISTVEEQNNTKEIKINYEKVFCIVDKLIAIFTQDQELTTIERNQWIRDFNFLHDVNQKIQWKGWKQHDLKNAIATILALLDFDNARKSIQENSEYKENYKDTIRKNNQIIAIVDEKECLWDLLQDLELLDTDFIKALDVVNIDPLLQNRQWKLYLLGVAYNLYKNALRFNIKN